MPSLKDLLVRGETTRVCSVAHGCGQELPLVSADGQGVFAVKRAGSVEHVTRMCLECKRRRGREVYAQNPEDVKARVAQWRKNNRSQINRQIREKRRTDPEWAERQRNRQRRGNMMPEQAEKERERQRAYIARPEVRARVREYRRQYDAILREAGAASMRELQSAQRRVKKSDLTPEETQRRQALKRYQALREKAQLTHEELDYLMIVAPLPAAAMRPLLVTVLAQSASEMDLDLEQTRQLRRWQRGQYEESDDLIGVARLAAVSGVPPRTINRAFEEGAHTMPLDTADRLFIHTDYTLDDLSGVASEWAMLTGDPWPIGYRGVKKILEDLRYDVKRTGSMAA